ncbi:hypothetical protein Bbelb_415610 [Branchiostoma belcheri]|nr:hypothetical protein Bbelb_415610 [Branchiostoma belcheri]
MESRKAIWHSRCVTLPPSRLVGSVLPDYAETLKSPGLREATILPSSSTEDSLMPPDSTKVLPVALGEPPKIMSLPLINGPLRLPNGDAIVPVAVEKNSPVPPPPFDVDDHVVL